RGPHRRHQEARDQDPGRGAHGRHQRGARPQDAGRVRPQLRDRRGHGRGRRPGGGAGAAGWVSMSILVDGSTRVVVQGLTGREGTFHALRCKEYGTRVVGGVTPGKGGSTHEGFPVWNTVDEAVAAAGADCALIFVPPPAAADAIMEAADAGVRLIVCITEGVPVTDMVRVNAFLSPPPSLL